MLLSPPNSPIHAVPHFSPRTPQTMLPKHASGRLVPTSYHPPYEQTASFATFDTRQVRKQSHSCDQCRKGKRRCDAVVYKNFSPSGQDQDPMQYPAPCSYCKRTRKQCTYTWLLSQKSRRGSRSTAFTEEEPSSPHLTTESLRSENNSPTQESSSSTLDYVNGYHSFPTEHMAEETAFDKPEDNVYPWHSAGDLTPPYLRTPFCPTYNHLDPSYYGPTNNSRPEINYNSLKFMEEGLTFFQTRQTPFSAPRSQAEHD
jgi:hypothetical protein